MSPIDVDVVRRKLATIQRAIPALEQLGAMPLAQYRADLIRRKAAERLLQESIEAAVDVSLHVLAREGRALPASSFGAFQELASAGVLPPELAAELAPATGLRNRLVHEYDAIDDAIVHAAIARACEVLPEFVIAIDRHLRR